MSTSILIEFNFFPINPYKKWTVLFFLLLLLFIIIDFLTYQNVMVDWWEIILTLFPVHIRNNNTNITCSVIRNWGQLGYGLEMAVVLAIVVVVAAVE